MVFGQEDSEAEFESLMKKELQELKKKQKVGKKKKRRRGQFHKSLKPISEIRPVSSLFTSDSQFDFNLTFDSQSCGK